MATLSGYLSEDEQAERLGKTRRTLQLWRQRGVAPPYTKIGKAIFYRDEAVAEWLRGQEQQPVRQMRKAGT